MSSVFVGVRKFSVAALGAVVVGALLPMLPAIPAPAALASTPTYDVETVSSPPDGLSASGLSVESSNDAFISADGRFVAYDANSQAMVTDRATGHTVVVSHANGDPSAWATSPCRITGMSADGRYVLFTSQAQNLTADGSYPFVPLPYVADTVTGVVTPVPVPAAAADSPTVGNITADGRYVLIAQSSWGKVPHVFVVDRTTGDARELSGFTSNDLLGSAIAISGDGGTVAFVEWNSTARTNELRVYDISSSSFIYSNTNARGEITMSDDGHVVAWDSHDWSTVKVARPYEGKGFDVHQDYGTSGPALSRDGNTLFYSGEQSDTYYNFYSLNIAGLYNNAWGAGTLAGVTSSGSPIRSYGINGAGATENGTGAAFVTSGLRSDCCTLRWDVAYTHIPDAAAPTWDSDAKLTAANVTGSSLTLNWPAASDDTGVTGYSVSEDGHLVADVLTATTYQVDGLEPGSHHTFTVEARDIANHMTDLPSLDVTTPSGNQAGSAPLSAIAAPGGIATLQWDADAAADAYRVLRAMGDGSFETVADNVTTTTWKDAGLLASTHYRYVVEAISGGTASAYTTEASIDTPAITITDVQVLPDKVDGGAINAAGHVDVKVDGEANRSATAVLHWENAADTTVNLAENTPGGYAGSATVPAGATKLLGVTGTLTDGVDAHAVSADAAGLPLPISGTIEVTVLAPKYGDLNGSTLSAFSGTLRAGAHTTISGPGTYDLAVTPADDYGVSVTLPDGRTIGSTDGISVSSNAVSSATVQTVWPDATLTVHLLPPDGETAGGFKVHVTNNYNYYKEIDLAAGQTDATFTGLATGASYAVEAKLDDLTRPIKQDIEQDVTLGEGPNDLTLQETALPKATIAGVVTADGTPYAGATIKFTENVDSRSWTFSATSGSDGGYSAAVLAGSVGLTTVNPPFGYYGFSTTVDAPAGVTTNVDVAFGMHDGEHVVHRRLYTRDFGGQETLQTLDWTTNYHFHTTLTDADGNQLAAYGNDSLVPTTSSALTFCADGREAGMNKGCVTEPLDRYEATLELHLSQSGAVTASLLAPDGSQLSGRWAVTATPVDAKGNQIGSDVTTGGDGAAMRFGVPNPGLYRIQISGAGGSYITTVNVPDQTQVDLGAVQLVSRTPFVASGTSVVAVPASVLPGQLVEIRTQYEAATTMSGAVLRLAVPLGTTLLTEGVTLNGQPVSGSMVDGYYEVPIGDLVAGDTGVVRYSLQVASDTQPGDVAAAVRVRYNGLLDDPVGVATVQVIGVRMFAPEHVTTPSVVVRGQAPAGSPVQISEGGTVIGTATAGPGGLWSTTVSLVDPFIGQTYWLAATASYDGTTLTSNSVGVKYDPSWVQPTSITVSQPSGRAHTFDPSLGIAYFTLVYVPKEPVRVAATFPDTSRLLHPTAWVGGNSAPMTCTATTCTADVSVTAETLGDIWVDYDVAPVQYATPDDVPVPTADQLAQMSHTPWGDITDVQTNGNTVSGNVGGEPFSLTFTESEGSLPAGMTPMTGSIPGYFSADIEPSAGTATVTVAIPKSWLDLSSTTLQSAMSSALVQTSAMSSGPRLMAAIEPPPADAIYEMGQMALTAAANRPNLKTPGPTPIDKLLVLDDQIAESTCSPEEKAQMRDIVEESAVFASFTTGASKVTGWVSNLLPAKLGLIFGTGVTGEEDHLVDNDGDDTTAEIHHDIDGCGKTRLWTPTKPPVAHPTNIFDPSGYTYEALAWNRLAGVTATIETAPTADGPWTTWDAADFGQDNPQITDSQGRYGWDVPVGWYRVRFDKDGYFTAYSKVVQVLPEWTDLNVGLGRIAPATVTGVSISPEQISVSFDTWMKVDSVKANAVVEGPGRSPVFGQWVPLDAQTAPDGTVLATMFAYKPERGYHGNEVDVTIGAATQDYAGVQLGQVVYREFPLHGGKP